MHTTLRPLLACDVASDVAKTTEHAHIDIGVALRCCAENTYTTRFTVHISHTGVLKNLISCFL